MPWRCQRGFSMALSPRAPQIALRAALVGALVGAVVLVALGSAAVAPPATPVRAATGFVQTLGTGHTTSSPVTITTTAAASAGNSIIVSASGSGGLVQCSDPINGAYRTDVDANAGSLTAICSDHNI